MVYKTDDHIQRAQGHINSKDIERLPYACLELRFALERIAYQKLKLRLQYISAKEINGWQPSRVIHCLMELVDEHIDTDVKIHVSSNRENENSSDGDFVLLGQVKGVSARELGRHWHKLGYFLHTRMPTERGGVHVQSLEQLSSYLLEVIEYVKDVTRSRFDACFSSSTIMFKCVKCEKSIVRNSNLLNNPDLIFCQNANCDASYIYREKDDEYEIEPDKMTFICSVCQAEAVLNAAFFRKMPTTQRQRITCKNCESRHLVGWQLYQVAENS